MALKDITGLEIINNNQHNYVIYPEYKEITITKNNNSIIFLYKV